MCRRTSSYKKSLPWTFSTSSTFWRAESESPMRLGTDKKLVGFCGLLVLQNQLYNIHDRKLVRQVWDLYKKVSKVIWMWLCACGYMMMAKYIYKIKVITTSWSPEIKFYSVYVCRREPIKFLWRILVYLITKMRTPLPLRMWSSTNVLHRPLCWGGEETLGGGGSSLSCVWNPVNV